MLVSLMPRCLPPSALGETAALLTSACNSPWMRSLISAMAWRVLSASARSTWMWSSGPASHGQFSGNGWREQVITRQPAAEKRFTVACPMPRLAPVRSSVRRAWVLVVAIRSKFLLCGCRSGVPTAAYLGIQPRLAPGRTGLIAAEFDAVVQPVWPVVPEFHDQRHGTVA